MATQAELLDFVKKLAADGELQKIISDGVDAGELDDLLKLAQKHGLSDVAPDQLRQALENYDDLDKGVIGKLLKKFFG